MTWRFADLPIRTKFLVTLGIPVLGLVLLIGKQVDSSLKRRNVMEYVRVQASNIGSLSHLLHELQKERGASIGLLADLDRNGPRLRMQYTQTDAAIRALYDPALERIYDVHALEAFTGLETIRERTLRGHTSMADLEAEYLRMDEALMADLGRITKTALDPESKSQLYALLNLLNSKETLSMIGTRITRALYEGDVNARERAELEALIARYSTNMMLFERDAPKEVMAVYQASVQGPDINLIRSIIASTLEQHGTELPDIPVQQWWEMSQRTLDAMQEAESAAVNLIAKTTEANLQSAQNRLFITIVALIGVITAVMIMAWLIMRGIRNTVNEVRGAALALASGDVRANVPVNSNDEIGEMARTFNTMIENIRSLAASAESIGKGNYETPVEVRGPEDVLGTALTRMKANLKAARLRDEEQTLALTKEKLKLEKAHEQIQVLIKEIHHRVKNNLQVIASLLRLQAGSIDDERLLLMFEQSQSRVLSMALIHEKLYKGDELARVDLALYLKELFSELVRLNDVRDSIHYHTDIEPGLELDLNTMVPLGLILNELITNSFKHAFRDRANGNIHLSIKPASATEFDLVYTDDGVGIPMEKLQHDGATLGVSLIESLVEQLNGYMTVDGGSAGTSYHIRFRTGQA